MDKYRIDNPYQSVYRYSTPNGCFIFLAGFFEIGITSDMSEAEQIEKIGAWMGSNPISGIKGVI